MNRITFAAMLCSALAGCVSPWPSRGTGGYAEHMPSATTRLPLACERERLDLLREAGALRRFPADGAELEKRYVRALRASVAGLEDRAGTDVAKLREALDRLDDRLRQTGQNTLHPSDRSSAGCVS